MIALVISACLAAHPGVCRDYRIPLVNGIDPGHCMTNAQPHFARWAEHHPGWQIVRWHCASADVQDL
jgi:hypothetical protein